MMTALLAISLLGVGQETPDERQALTQVHELAKTFAQAFHKHDHARLAELTPPKIAAKVGSRNRLAQAWRQKTTAYRNQGLRLERYDVEAPKQIVKVEADWLVIVPTALSFQATEGSARRKSYLLALSGDQGKSWHFLDGADGDTIKNARAWLPKLPESVAFPEVAPARVDKADGKRNVFTSIAANFKVAYPDSWERGQREENIILLHLEKGDNAIYVFAEDLNLPLDEVVRFYDRNRSTGKPRRFFGQKEMTVAGEKAKFFRFDDSSDQELQQYYVCAVNHHGYSYRIIGFRRGGNLPEFEQEYFSLLERFAFLKDRPAWVKQHEGAPTKAIMLGGLASFGTQRPRWTEDTFDNQNENRTLDYITLRYLPGNAWIRMSLHDAQVDLNAELQEILAAYLPRYQDAKHKAITFTTSKGKWPGWELQGVYSGAPRTIYLTAVINDGIAAWILLESAPHQLEDTRFDYEELLETFHLQAKSRPSQPLAFPLRQYDDERGADPRVAAIIKKATRLYPGAKAHEILGFTADGKHALLQSAAAYVLEDLVTKKRDPLPIKGIRPFNLVISPDRRWLAYQVNDEITVYPLGFGFTRKVRAQASFLGFGPNNKELLILTSSQKPRYDYQDDYRGGGGGGGLGMQYVTSRLERLPLDNSPKKALFDWPLIRVQNFSLAGNGKLLAVVTNRDFPRTQQFGGYLYLCKSDGSELRLLNKDPADYRALAWSQDGRAVYALRRVLRGPLGGNLSGGGNQYDVERIALDTGESLNLTRCGRISHLWAGGADLFLELRDSGLPMAQQGIFRISAAELARATATFPASKVLAPGVLAERVAKRLEPLVGKKPLRQFVPTTASMQDFAKEFTAAIKDETGLVLEATPEALDRLAGVIDSLELASGKHPINILGVGAYYGETLRKLVGATWHIKPVPFGEWAPTRTPYANNVAEVILPFSDTYGWAMLSGRVVNSHDLRTRASGFDWLLVYPPTHVDEMLKAGFADYQKAKKLLDEGEIKVGLELLAAEMKKRPKNVQLARELIALSKAVERNDLATAYTKQAVEAGIEASDLLVLHADQLMLIDATRAIVYYRKAAQVGYAQPETLIKLGKAYAKAGDTPMADSCWRRAYLPATDLARIEIRRLMGMPDFRPYDPGIPLGGDKGYKK